MPLSSPASSFRADAFRRGLCALALFAVAASRGAAPAFEWQMATPESHGLSPARLDAARDTLAARATKALLVVHDDRIVYEWYAADHGPAKPHYTASMAKAVVGGMAVAVALTDGRLALDDAAAKYVPQWRADPRKARITLRQLGSHTSGIEDAETGDIPHNRLTGWKGEFWQPRDPPHDAFTVSRDAAPLIAEPGQEMHYSNPGIAMLAYATTAALKAAPQPDIRTLLRDRVLRPIGASDREWSLGYGKTVMIDGLPLVGTWGGAALTARAAARIGRLMLREGDWDGRRLLTPEAVRAVTRDAGTPGNCGIGWWSNNDGTLAAVPRDAFWGAGAQDQLLLVVPSRQLIVVRNGGALSRDEPKAEARTRYFFETIMAALPAR